MSVISDIKEIPTIVDNLKDLRYSKSGLLVFVIIELIVFGSLYKLLQGLAFYYIEYWLCIIILMITIITWLIGTNRLFFRDKWNILYWIIGFIIMTSVFPLYIYPRFIADSNYDIRYMQTWGTILFAIMIGICLRLVKHRFFVNNNLIIVFAVDSISSIAEKTIRYTIKKAITNIQK